MKPLKPIDPNPFVSEYDKQECDCDYCGYWDECTFVFDRICKFDTDYTKEENNAN